MEEVKKFYEEYQIECGYGWYSLIKPIVDYINAYNKNLEEDKKIKILQIKEKFSGLRFYCNFYNEILHELIREAEHDSYRTCEFCGSTHEVGQTIGGWITTICKKCIENQAITNQKERLWGINENGEFNKYIIRKDGSFELFNKNKLL